MTGPRLYGELAEWWHLLSDPADYAEEASIFASALEQYTERPLRTVLELGCGGGNNASHLKRRYRMTLSDLSPGMLDMSRKLNPECEHVQGDMRTVRLDRTFDAVFVHDAIDYMTTEADLEATMRTAHVHLAVGGPALFVPDDTTESYRPRASTGGHDGDGRSIRYVQWDDPPKRGQQSYKARFVYTFREGDREWQETDVHIVGLFPRATWISLMECVGFEVETIPFRHSEFSPDAGHELFVGLKR